MGMMTNIASLRCGTPYTMAPEIFFHQQFSKPVYSQKCDIWSIGVILHEILYQSHPFGLKSDNILKGQRTKIRKEHGYLDLLIDKCLVNNPNRRINWIDFKKIY